MLDVPRFEEFSERDFVALKVIDSHRGSGDEQNQRVSGATRVEPRRIGAKVGLGQVECGEVGKRTQQTSAESFAGHDENF